MARPARRSKTTGQIAVVQKKKDQLSLAQYGINYAANRPDPDDPGGLGAEESGTERTGPTQDFILATQQGARLAEVGRYYDSANDPVTACFWLDRGHGQSVA
jgi:hypothetical protein